MMTELVLQTPEVFKRLDQPSRYKGAYGGRGSGGYPVTEGDMISVTSDGQVATAQCSPV